MMKLFTCIALGWLIAINSFATTYTCSSTSQIISALASVQAGDEIIISSGTYVSDIVVNASYFYSDTDGTASNPITIRSASSTNRAHLQGPDNMNGTVLRIEGDYWIVKDLEISIGLKALVFDNSQHSSAINCVTHSTGNEAIHVRDGSDYTTIDGCKVYNTGNVNPGFGEGIYVGTDKASWFTKWDPYCDYTVIKNCTIGPNVRAEPLDIKEGTQETIIEYNTIDARGISGVNYSDSFIDLKGVRTYVRYNTFNMNGESGIEKGIAGINRGVELSSYEHVIHDNVFNMEDPSINMIEAHSGTLEIYAVKNTRNPIGEDYNSRVVKSCPTWYDGCADNILPEVTITTPANNSLFASGGNITISASASDSDGTVVGVKFYAGDDLLGEDTSSPYSFDWINVEAGNYNLTAVAVDDDGDYTVSSSVFVGITLDGASNSAPEITISSPNNGGSFITGNDITIISNATDTDGEILSVKFYLDDNLLGEDTSSPYSFDLVDAKSGSYRLTATATDNNNWATTSSEILIRVGDDPSGKLSLVYYASDKDPLNNKIRPYLKIVNDSPTAAPYETLKIRYWFTKDVSSTLKFECDNADIGDSFVKGEIMEVSQALIHADHYLEVSFDPAAGSLAAEDDSGHIKLRITNSNNSLFDESNDYSFDETLTNYTSYDRITLYQNDVLIWGAEPELAEDEEEEEEEEEIGDDLSLEYYSADTDADNAHMEPYLKIFNNNPAAVPYETLKIRYWFTKDVSATLNFACEDAAVGSSLVKGEIVEVSPVLDKADHYLEVSFDPAAGSLAAEDDSGEIKLKITNNSNSNFIEKNDFSYDPAFTEYTSYNRITLYQNDVLIWGAEPELAEEEEEEEEIGDDLSLEYYSADTDADNDHMEPYLRIFNNNPAAVPYETLKIRYWFTKDVTATLSFACEDAAVGSSLVKGEIVEVSPALDKADHYLEVSFDSAAGSLDAEDDSGEIKLKITNSNNSLFDESNDFSFDETLTNYTSYDRITLYQNDVLIWGAEPELAEEEEENEEEEEEEKGDTTDLVLDVVPKSTFLIFPNPTTDYLTITTNDHELIDEVKILSLAGQIEYSHGMVNQRETVLVDISSLSQGYYIVIVHTDSSVFRTKIFKK